MNIKIKKQLEKTIKEEGACHLTLIDPDEQTPKESLEMAKEAEKAGSDGIMIGGSGVDQDATRKTCEKLNKKIDIPKIIVPGDTSSINKHADAIFFMSLLNSRSRYWLSMAQAFGSFSVKKAGLEPISVGYLILESSNKTSVEFYGDANIIPRDKHKITAAFCLAAQYMGMDYAYLEGGSGANEPVPNKTIKLIKQQTEIPIIVGGGIRNKETAREKVKAGADVIVTGTIAEEAENTKKKIREIVEGTKSK